MSQLKEYFSYKKFAEDRLKIIVLYKSYFLQDESIADFKTLGHTVVPVPVVDEPKQMLDSLLKTCLDVKPDFILGTNHIGFDPEGKIAAILEELKIPVAFWYLDDFHFIIPDARVQAHSNIAIFSFEQNNLDSLNRFGFEHVFYLPAGSTLKKGTDWKDSAYTYLHNRISFVGNTFLDAQDRWHKAHYPDLYSQLKLDKWNVERGSFIQFIKQEMESKFSNLAELYHFVGYAAGRSTMDHRVNLLKQIDKPVVFGDRHWPDLDLDLEIHPPVHMTREAPKVFNASQINLNISSTQLTTSVNQRIFDVPLADGFLLTDWRESLADLFAVDSELAVYHNVDDLQEKIGFYQKNESARRKITQAAAQHIYKEHLLIFRLQKMLKQLKSVFG